MKFQRKEFVESQKTVRTSNLAYGHFWHVIFRNSLNIFIEK